MIVASDIAVEVIFPDDKASDLSLKLAQYRQAGVCCCRIVDPVVGQVEVRNCATGSSQIDRESDTLTDDELLPGFSVAVESLFPAAARDTVPLCVWAAGRFGDDYRAAVLAVAEAGGDHDTTAAIVGGIVAGAAGREVIPADWLAHCEPLPEWFPVTVA